MNIEKTVKIIFQGEDKELSKTISGIDGKFNSIGAAADSIAAPLAKAADLVMKVDAALAALVVGGLALAIKHSSDFNQGFALISTSIDATGKDLAKYRDDVLQYSTTSVKSIADINASLYTAAQAGIKYSESLEFMGKAEQLAVANNANLNTTVDLLTGTMNAYGFQLKDVGHLNDVFFQSTLIGKQTIDDLGQSMGQVVGIAANFGVSFEALSGAIATLTAKGMKTEEAITAVKNVITTIVKPSKEAEKAAADLGLTFNASTLKAKGFEQMLKEIMQATGGSADKISELFGEVRAMNGIMQLTGDGMVFFNKAMNDITNSTGAAEGAYQKMVGTFKNQSQMMINTAQNLLIDVGTRLEPIAAGISGSLSQVLAGIKIGVDNGAFDPLFKMLEEAGKEIASWLAGVAKALPDALKDLDFSKLTDALRAFGKSFGDYFKDIDLTNVEDLHGFIQKIIDGIAGLVRVSAAMVEAFQPFIKAIKDFLLGMAEGDKQTLETVGKLLALGKVVKEAGLAFTGAIEFMDKYGLSMKGLLNITAGGIQILWNFAQQLYNLATVSALVVQGKFSEIPAVLQQMRQDGYDAESGLQKIVKGFEQVTAESGKAKEAMAGANKEMDNIPAEKKSIITFEGTEAIKSAITEINKEFVKVGQAAAQALPSEKYMVVGYIESEGSRTEILEKINSTIPAEKKIDVMLDAEKIKADAKIIETSIQWKAKIDIAQAEAATKTLKEMTDSVGTGIKSTGDLLGTLFGQLNKGGNRWNEDAIKSGINSEMKRREEQFELQKKILEQQLEMGDLNLQGVKDGKGIKISVEASGLQPHLEMILWEILKKIQVRANATPAEFLLGIGN